MKKLGMLLALCFAFTLAMMAQNDMGSMGQSSSQTTTKKHKTAKGVKEHTLTGCLQEGTTPGTYELVHGKRQTMVTGSEELKDHVGHKVKLTGIWEMGALPESSESPATEKTEKKAGKEEREFKVTNIKHLSSTCTMGKKSKGTMGGTGF